MTAERHEDARHAVEGQDLLCFNFCCHICAAGRSMLCSLWRSVSAGDVSVPQWTQRPPPQLFHLLLQQLLDIRAQGQSFLVCLGAPDAEIELRKSVYAQATDVSLLASLLDKLVCSCNLELVSQRAGSAVPKSSQTCSYRVLTAVSQGQLQVTVTLCYEINAKQQPLMMHRLAPLTQVVSTAILGIRYARQLPLCMMLQTMAFVAFNKVRQ